MSDLLPEGAKLVFDGTERHLYWDYGVIEKVQELYGGHPLIAIEKMFWEGQLGDGQEVHYNLAKPVLDLLTILLNNEVEREKFFEGKTNLKTYTREQVGHIIDRGNAGKAIEAIVASWMGSTPSAEDDGNDEDDDLKNQ